MDFDKAVSNISSKCVYINFRSFTNRLLSHLPGHLQHNMLIDVHAQANKSLKSDEILTLMDCLFKFLNHFKILEEIAAHSQSISTFRNKHTHRTFPKTEKILLWFQQQTKNDQRPIQVCGSVSIFENLWLRVARIVIIVTLHDPKKPLWSLFEAIAGHETLFGTHNNNNKSRQIVLRCQAHRDPLYSKKFQPLEFRIYWIWEWSSLCRSSFSASDWIFR